MKKKRKPVTVPNVTKDTQTITQKERSHEAEHTKAEKKKKEPTGKTYYSTMPDETKRISDYEQCVAMDKNTAAKKNPSKKDEQQTTATMTETSTGQRRRSTKRKP